MSIECHYWLKCDDCKCGKNIMGYRTVAEAEIAAENNGWLFVAGISMTEDQDFCPDCRGKHE